MFLESLFLQKKRVVLGFLPTVVIKILPRTCALQAVVRALVGLAQEGAPAPARTSPPPAIGTPLLPSGAQNVPGLGASAGRVAACVESS